MSDIFSLIQKPALRKKLVFNAIKDVKKFSWDTVASQYEKVYRSVL